MPRLQKSVTIGDSVTSIGEDAFLGCDKLVEVINKSSLDITAGSTDYGRIAYYAMEVHNGTTKIVNQNDYLFYPYSGVNYLVEYVGTDTELTLPESYNGQSYEINDRAFYNCSSLTSITISNSVTSIGDWAFYDCDILTSICFDGTVEQWNAIKKGFLWDLGTATYTIYCTDGTIAKYGRIIYY